MRSTKISFTQKERKDLLKTWILVGAVFTLAHGVYRMPEVLLIGALSFIVGGASIIIHELAHKIVALRKGCGAEFHANNSMSIVSILVAFFGLILLAPGAVHVRGAQTKKENGLIALAGPESNILLAALCAAGLALIPLSTGSLVQAFLSFGLLINTWLAVFNLIPFPPFDGRAVWKWSRPVFFVSAGLCVILIILQEFI